MREMHFSLLLVVATAESQQCTWLGRFRLRALHIFTIRIIPLIFTLLNVIDSLFTSREILHERTANVAQHFLPLFCIKSSDLDSNRVTAAVACAQTVVIEPRINEKNLFIYLIKRAKKIAHKFISLLNN